jgi:demethylmenaquinone methyltransferase/2-methoxy-6-polyprenyl-1,4-benzoquinol methylase
MEEESQDTTNIYINALENTAHISEGAIRQALKEINFFNGCKIIDIPCGIGTHIGWMFEENKNIFVTGVDINEKIIDYARSKLSRLGLSKSWELQIGDMNELNIGSDTYDFVWCCDGLWVGPKEMGCASEKPYAIIESMKRITKKWGIIAILYWSGQKLLPGYPLLEAALNSTLAANIPFNAETGPELHYMRTPLWMGKAGLKNIKSRTFSANIQGPFNKQDKTSITNAINMFWQKAESEVSDGVWKDFKKIIDPNSPEYILDQEGYAGYINYTMFTGEVIK